MISISNYWNVGNVPILNKSFTEHNQDSVDASVSQQVRTDLEEYNKWK